MSSQNKNIIKIGNYSFRLSERNFEIVEILDHKGTVVDFFESKQLINRIQKDFTRKVLKLPIEQLASAFAELFKQYEEALAKKKTRVPIGFEDIDWEGISKENVLHGAGGFTADFAYETTYVPTTGGRNTWMLIACDGEKREAHILKPTNNELTIFGKKYLLPETPIITLRTLWGSKSVYEFINHSEHDPEATEVFKEILDLSKYFVYYVDTSKHILTALWIIGTYFYELFSAYPYDVKLGIRETGKTTALLLAVYLAYHGKEIFDATKSAAFRMIETAKPTLGFDEVEKLYQKPNRQRDPDTLDFLTLIDVGYRAGASVPRTEWNDETERYEIKEYGAYNPKAFAILKVLTESTASRSISSYMVKSGEAFYSDRRPQLKAIPFDETDEMAKTIQECRDRLYKCRFLYARAVKTIYQGLKGSDFGISDRYWELWRPIFTICRIFAPEQLESLISIVTSVIHEQQTTMDADDISNALTSACLETVENLIDVAEKQGGTIPSTVEIDLTLITDKFNEIFQPTKPYKEKSISTLLKNLGLPKRGRKTDPRDRSRTVLIPLAVLAKQAQRFGFIDSATKLSKYISYQNYVATPPPEFYEELARRGYEDNLQWDLCELRSNPLCQSNLEFKIVRFLEITDSETGEKKRVRACFECLPEGKQS